MICENSYSEATIGLNCHFLGSHYIIYTIVVSTYFYSFELPIYSNGKYKVLSACAQRLVVEHFGRKSYDEGGNLTFENNAKH